MRFARIWFDRPAYAYLESLPQWKRDDLVRALERVRSGEHPVVRVGDELWVARDVAGFTVDCAVDERDPRHRELAVLRLRWLGDGGGAKSR